MAQSNILQATSFLVEPDQQSTIDTLVKNTSYYSTDTDTDDTGTSTTSTTNANTTTTTTAITSFN
ncbi:341_t:CDS:1, partial [Entrophospora sp. SA101]